MTSTADTTREPRVSQLAARLSILLAAVMWSMGGLFAKAPTFDDWPPGSRGILLSFWRALFAGVLLVPFARRRTWRPLLVPLGVSFTAMSALYLSSMSLTTAANAIWLQSTAPLWIFVIGVCLGVGPLDRRDLITLAFAMLGVGLILFHELAGQALVGVICGLGAGIAYAVVVLLMRQLRSEDARWIVAVNHLAAALLLSPFVVYEGVLPSTGQLVVLALFGVLQMAIPYLLFVRALRTLSGQEASGISLVEPVLVPIWVYLAWGEAPAWWTLLGGAFILVGLALRYAVRTADAVEVVAD